VALEQYITRFVYQHKEITLQGIGIIKLDDVVPDQEYLQKHKSLPITSLIFEHKPSVATTPAFIKYYSETRGKILSLAENDVEAFLGMALQFLNIGNPVEFKGLGTLTKQKDGSFVMAPGYFIVLKEDENNNRFKDRVVSEEAGGDTNFFGKKEPQSSNSAKLIIAIAIGAIVVLAGWWLYTTFLKEPAETASTASTTDTLNVPQQVVTPPTTAVPDTNATNTTAITNVDSGMVQKWKAVFREELDKTKALQVWANYQKVSTPVQMETADSASFRFFVVIESSLRDATRKSDSLSRFFARPVKLEPLK
jgi:hypothetical protein